MHPHRVTGLALPAAVVQLGVMPLKRRLVARFGWALVNLLAGAGVFVFVWAASGYVDSGTWGPLVTTVILCTPVILALSGLAAYFSKSSLLFEAAIFSPGFLVAAALCLPGLFESSWKPLLFWTALLIWVLAIALTGSGLGLLIHRRLDGPKLA